jgi:hypothetical protein
MPLVGLILPAFGQEACVTLPQWATVETPGSSFALAGGLHILLGPSARRAQHVLLCLPPAGLTMFAVTVLMAWPPSSLRLSQKSAWYLLLRVNSLPSKPSVTCEPRPASFTFLAVSRPGQRRQHGNTVADVSAQARHIKMQYRPSCCALGASCPAVPAALLQPTILLCSCLHHEQPDYIATALRTIMSSKWPSVQHHVVQYGAQAWAALYSFGCCVALCCAPVRSLIAPAALPLQLCQNSCTSELRASFVVDLWQPSYHFAASRSS